MESQKVRRSSWGSREGNKQCDSLLSGWGEEQEGKLEARLKGQRLVGKLSWALVERDKQ